MIHIFKYLYLREIIVVAIGFIVPHVRGHVAVDVGVAEVGGEAEAHDEASEDTEPASGAVTEVVGEY